MSSLLAPLTWAATVALPFKYLKMSANLPTVALPFKYLNIYAFVCIYMQRCTGSIDGRVDYPVSPGCGRKHTRDIYGRMFFEALTE
ncbi:unnamed protein product [Sphenostylis stenocarpa]|uniref:Uncharacterized protein n=1 Tax=Sphenostylis stenocarpa TaxID=92480 RepID=A0AA86SX20_9FABA|nr:unnamed protein product [Sphenostylis stenocarpa]